MKEAMIMQSPFFRAINNKRSCINDDATPLIVSVFYVL